MLGICTPYARGDTRFVGLESCEDLLVSANEVYVEYLTYIHGTIDIYVLEWGVCVFQAYARWWTDNVHEP